MRACILEISVKGVMHLIKLRIIWVSNVGASTS